jgi:hypothetical protein
VDGLGVAADRGKRVFCCQQRRNGVAHLQVVDTGDGLQISRVAANILNKQLGTAGKGWSWILKGYAWG